MLFLIAGNNQSKTQKNMDKSEEYTDKPQNSNSMILQLNPTILVETPLGRGHAIFIIDYGMHQNTCWVVALEKNGVVKHFDSNSIIVATNFTYAINTDRNKDHFER